MAMFGLQDESSRENTALTNEHLSHVKAGHEDTGIQAMSAITRLPAVHH